MARKSQQQPLYDVMGSEPVSTMAIKALAPVYGSNRILGSDVGKLLRGCSFVGIAFAGGLCEVPHITARTIVCNDLNRAAVNLGMVAADPEMGQALRCRLDAMPFHPDTLIRSQERCRDREQDPEPWKVHNLEWAIDYFVCAWMARNGTAGTDAEFRAGLSVRWDSGGGDSVVRFRNAAEALKDWQDVLARVTFQTLDAFEFLAKCKDVAGHGYYCDPPWPDDGDQYKHKFGEPQHRRLAAVLRAYKQARVVVRYGDHPLIRELYPEPLWTWHRLTGRTSANKDKAEVLIVNRIGG